jgi:hypothetical protein
VNQVLQRAVAHENHARDSRSQGRFRDNNKERERSNVNMVDESLSNDEEEVCVAEWVNTPQARPMKC